MAVLDTTVVDIIVPKLRGPLSTDIYGAQWVITSYMIAAATGLIIVEWLIKRYGNKTIYIIGVAIFTITSFGCGISTSLAEIIFFRSLQGFAEALVMVTAQALLFSMFPPQKRGVAMGIFALGVAFAPAVGPTLGGYLTNLFSWRAVFFVNVPIGILLVIFSLLLLEDKGKKEPFKLNFISLIFLSAFTISLLILLSKGQQYGWFNSSFISFLGFFSYFSLIGFIISEFFSKNRIFDYSLFKNYNYTLGILVYFVLLGFSMYQYFYLIPIYYEHLKGLNSIQTGLGVLGFGIYIGIFSIIAGILTDKISPIPILILAGITYIYTGFFLFPSLNYYTPFYEAVIKTMPFGIAMGLFFTPITVLVMNNSNQKIEQAIMTMDYVRFIGGSFGTAIATNNLVFFHQKELQGIKELENFEIIKDFPNKILHALAENFMAFNDGFRFVWLDAAFWGAIGTFFIFLIPLKGKKWFG